MIILAITDNLSLLSCNLYRGENEGDGTYRSEAGSVR